MLNGFRALDVAIKSAHDNATAQCKKEKETKMHLEDNMKFWQRVGQRMIAKIMSNPSDEVNGGTKAACNTKFGTAECILDPITECKYSELGKRGFCLPIKEAPIDKIFLAPRCDLRTTMGRVQDNIEAWLRTGMFGQHCLSKPNINIASPGGAGGQQVAASLLTPIDRWLVGSSSSSRSGFAKMAAARAVRTRQPPESALICRSISCAEKPRLLSSVLARSSAVSASMSSSELCTSTSRCDCWALGSSIAESWAASARRSRRSMSACTTYCVGVQPSVSSSSCTSCDT